MPLDGTYDGLKASVARWLTREDLTDVIPDFIALAEARLNDRLRLAPMERDMTISQSALVSSVFLVDETTGAILTDESDGALLTDEAGNSAVPVLIGTAPLPSDFIEMRALVANTSPKVSLKLAAPGWAKTSYSGSSGYPDVYTIIGSTLGVYPSTSASLTLTYYARIPALSDDAPSNWLLTQRPQLYLYASLIESAPLMLDDGRIATWKGLLDEAISDAQRSDMGTRWSNSVMTLSGPTP